ncbi:unnamed protein product [Victoria cruziana]
MPKIYALTIASTVPTDNRTKMTGEIVFA